MCLYAHTPDSIIKLRCIGYTNEVSAESEFSKAFDGYFLLLHTIVPLIVIGDYILKTLIRDRVIDSFILFML